MEFIAFEEMVGERDPREQMSMSYIKREQDEKKICVYFGRSPAKFTKEDLKLAMDFMKRLGDIKSGIIVLQGETSVVNFLF